MNNRFKNYGLWTSILAFIPLLLDGLKVYNLNLILPSNYDLLVKSLLGILVMSGILNNPTNGQGYLDKEK